MMIQSYFHLFLFGSISVEMDVHVDLHECVCVWLAVPSSVISRLTDWQTENILLFIHIQSQSSHTALTIPIYRQGPWERSEVTRLCLFPCSYMDLMCVFYTKLSVVVSGVKLNSCLSLCWNRRAADKMQTGHTVRTMVIYILHLLQNNKAHIYSTCFEVFPRTLCFSLELVCLLYEQDNFVGIWLWDKHNIKPDFLFYCPGTCWKVYFLSHVRQWVPLRWADNKSLLCTSTTWMLYFTCSTDFSQF